MNDVIEFDKQGFVPGRKVRTIDEYLRECEEKRQFLEATFSTTSELVGEYGQVVSLGEQRRQLFFQRYDTYPQQAIAMEREVFKRIVLCLYPNKNVAGTLGIAHRTRENNMPLSLLVKMRHMREHLAHESIHVIRLQWKTDDLDHDVEEIMAYNVFTPKKEYHRRIRKPYVAFMKEFVKLYHRELDTAPLRYAVQLLQKGEAEGINMNYIFLRACFREFNLSEPLEEQIAGKEGVKWDVIRQRLDITKAS